MLKTDYLKTENVPFLLSKTAKIDDLKHAILHNRF